MKVPGADHVTLGHQQLDDHDFRDDMHHAHLGLGLRVSDVGFRIWGLGFRASGPGPIMLILDWILDGTCDIAYEP